MAVRPPRLAERLLRLAFRGTASDVIAGDLEEEFHLRRTSDGTAAARRWYRRQVLRSLAIGVVSRRERMRSPGGEGRRRGDGWLRDFVGDLALATRLLARRPGFSLSVVLALAVGLGASTATFSIVDSVLLKPLPFADAQRLVTLRQRDVLSATLGAVAPATYLDWRDTATSLTATAAVRPWSFTLRASAGEPEVLGAGLVSEGFFDLLGLPPLLGRPFVPSDYEADSPGVAVLSHALWQARFGGDPSIIGRQVPFEGRALTIVGVLPPRFQWIDRDQMIWAPWRLSEQARQLRTQTYVRVVGRLRPDRSVTDVENDTQALHHRLSEAYPRIFRHAELVVVTLDEALLGGVRAALLLLFAAVGLVLLTTCASVANLVLAGIVGRSREFAIRGAVGADPVRIVRQILAECLLLAATGGVVGFLAAHVLVRTIAAATPGDVPRLDQAAVLDLRVLTFSLGLISLVAVLVSLAPAWRLSRADLSPTMRGGVASDPRSVGIRRWLVGLEAAITVVLLVGAGLLARSFVGLVGVDPGFSARDVAMLETHIWSTHPKPDQQVQFYDDALARIRAVPGVLSAGAVTALPFLGENSIEMETSVRSPGAAPEAERLAWLAIVTPDYFRTMGIPLLGGRTFDRRDDARSERVAVISARLAAREFATAPIGRMLVVSRDRTPTPVRVIGVVGDVRHVDLDGPPREEVFVPIAQAPFGSMSLVVRTSSDPAPFIPSLKEAVRRVNPTQTFGTVAALDTLVDATLAPRRFQTALVLALAVSALLLATLGTYGLVGLVAAARTREIAVRVALGGQRSDVLRLVFSNGLAAPLAGLVAGVGAALVLGRLLDAYLFGISPTDPITFIGVGAAVLSSAVVATYLPARRALRVDPVVTLRQT